MNAGFARHSPGVPAETDKSMRIAMFSWESMHSIALGGLAPHVSELSAALVRRGHEVHIFTRVGMNQSLYDSFDGVHYHRCPFEEHPDFVTSMERMCDSFVWHLGETEHFLGAPFDVVHGHDWLVTRALAQTKNSRHRPVVMTVHSTEYGRCGNSLWKDAMSERIRAMEWEGTYVANRVICVSRTLAREVQEQYQVPADKVHPIYNGVNVYKYDPPVDAAAVRRTVQVGVDDPMVFFAGRITWQKGPDILLDAVPGVLRDHPRTKFVFAGDGDMRPGLEQRASSAGIAGATRFLGHRNGGELVGLFKSADLICVPSRNEPFGIVILEAWSATKPVVATRIGGPSEFVENERTGLTVDADAQPIRLGVSRLITDRAGAARMGINGRQEVEARFSWDHAARETELVYDATVASVAAQGNGTSARHSPGGNTLSPSTDGTDHSRNGDAPPAAGENAPVGMGVNRNDPSSEAIRRRAHAIFLARKGKPGDPVADWLQAERELRAERVKSAKASGLPRDIPNDNTTLKSTAPPRGNGKRPRPAARRT